MKFIVVARSARDRGAMNINLSGTNLRLKEPSGNLRFLSGEKIEPGFLPCPPAPKCGLFSVQVFSYVKTLYFIIVMITVCEIVNIVKI